MAIRENDANTATALRAKAGNRPPDPGGLASSQQRQPQRHGEATHQTRFIGVPKDAGKTVGELRGGKPVPGRQGGARQGQQAIQGQEQKQDAH